MMQPSSNLHESIPAAISDTISPRIKQSSMKDRGLLGLLVIILIVGSVIGWRVRIKLKPGSMRVNPIDKAVMMWVPAGTFTMGSIPGVGHDIERPAHKVTLSGYWIYKNQVTVAQYRAFCVATAHPLPDWPGAQYSWTGKTGWDDVALQQHPIVSVSWDDAEAYANWAKARLPSEAQWEYAARGTKGQNFPWGGTATPADPLNGWDPAKCANDANSKEAGKSTWPVGSFPLGKSWCGAMDMGGNTLEWCSDWFAPYTAAAVANPTGAATGSKRVLRGASWMNVDDSHRVANRFRNSPEQRLFIYGFRCVSHAPPP